MIVNTIRLLSRIQAGYRSRDPEVMLCADSCLSFLVLHLKFDTLVLPTVLYSAYEALPESWPPSLPGSSTPIARGGGT